jgi:hypothetical protein
MGCPFIASMPMQLSLDPDVADLAPTDPALTRYDEEHLVTYLRMLDANKEGADWREVTRAVPIECQGDQVHQELSTRNTQGFHHFRFGRVSAYGMPSTAGRLNPIAIHARSNFSMNFPEWPG